MTAQFKENVDVLAVLKDMVKADDSSVTEGLVDLDLSDELNLGSCTFCLALDFLRVCLLTILMADTFLESRLVASKHLANPPLPSSLPFE